MRDKRATKRKRRKTNPLIILAMGTALILAGSWSYQLFKIDQSMESQKSQLVEQKKAFITENDKLRKDIEKLNTPSYIEQLARQKLGLVRKGEILIAPKESEATP
jgi:cell division protein DivIC